MTREKCIRERMYTGKIQKQYIAKKNLLNILQKCLVGEVSPSIWKGVLWGPCLKAKVAWYPVKDNVWERKQSVLI